MNCMDDCCAPVPNDDKVPGRFPFFKPKFFVVGGQTGADSMPFSVFEELGVQLRGWMPRGFKRDGGGGKAIAETYGLKEFDGGFGKKDRANCDLSDGLLGFLCTKPMTGKGTMQCVHKMVHGKYEFIQLAKPQDRDFNEYYSNDENSRPALVFWDLTEEKIPMFAKILQQWSAKHKPANLMISGSTENTYPGIEALGAQLLLQAFSEESSI